MRGFHKSKPRIIFEKKKPNMKRVSIFFQEKSFKHISYKLAGKVPSLLSYVMSNVGNVHITHLSFFLNWHFFLKNLPNKNTCTCKTILKRNTLRQTCTLFRI